MDPNAWQRETEGLVDDLVKLLRDRQRTLILINRLAQLATESRQRAWDEVADPVFRREAFRRPSTRHTVRRLSQRLRAVLFTGPAAEAPGRLRKLGSKLNFRP